MISIANILPTNMIGPNMHRQQYEMYLTNEVLNNRDVFSYLKEEHGIAYKILDNSACELGKGLDFDLVLHAAEIIGADEVVLPDLPRNKASLSYTLQYLNDVAQDCPYNLAAVAQGETKEEILNCIDSLLSLRRIKTIMIPKWYCGLNSTNGLGRVDLVKYVVDSHTDKQIHLLGMDVGLREIFHPVISQNVRSIDTGYFAALSTDQWKHLHTTDERPRELKIDLNHMDVDIRVWMRRLQDQERLLDEIRGEQ